MAKYPFSMWVYHSVNDFTPDELEIWAECGMTHPLSPAITAKEDPKKLIPFLDKAEELGMKLVLNYGEFTYSAYRPERAAEIEETMKRIHAEIGGHPAIYGYFLGDEPSTRRALQATIECFKIHKRVAPELSPFVNLMGGMGTFSNELLGDRTLDEWFAAVAEAGAEFVTQDNYGPMINDNCVTDSLLEIRNVVAAGEKAGVDVWANMLSSAHYAYRKPNEHEILWQITVPAACGCRGTVWFRFYDRLIGHEYYGSPIDEFGYKTETYYNILRAQKRFQAHYGELLMSLKRKSTFMRGKERGVYPTFEAGCHDLINIKCYEDVVISFYEDAEGKEYLVMANAYMDMHATIKICFDSEKCDLTEMLFNGTYEHKIEPVDPDAEWGGEYFNPGQMRIFRIDRK